MASSGYGGLWNLRENEALPHGLSVPDPGPAGGLPGGFPNLPGGLPAGMANNPMMQQVAGAVEETLKHGKLRFFNYPKISKTLQASIESYHPNTWDELIKVDV